MAMVAAYAVSVCPPITARHALRLPQDGFHRAASAIGISPFPSSHIMLTVPNSFDRG